MLKFLKNFLKKLEEANSKSFGNGRLDCCELNKPNNISSKPDNGKKQ